MSASHGKSKVAGGEGWTNLPTAPFPPKSHDLCQSAGAPLTLFLDLWHISPLPPPPPHQCRFPTRGSQPPPLHRAAFGKAWESTVCRASRGISQSVMLLRVVGFGSGPTCSESRWTATQKDFHFFVFLGGELQRRLAPTWPQPSRWCCTKCCPTPGVPSRCVPPRRDITQPAGPVSERSGVPCVTHSASSRAYVSEVRRAVCDLSPVSLGRMAGGRVAVGGSRPDLSPSWSAATRSSGRRS